MTCMAAVVNSGGHGVHESCRLHDPTASDEGRGLPVGAQTRRHGVDRDAPSAIISARPRLLPAARRLAMCVGLGPRQRAEHRAAVLAALLAASLSNDRPGVERERRGAGGRGEADRRGRPKAAAPGIEALESPERGRL